MIKVFVKLNGFEKKNLKFWKISPNIYCLNLFGCGVVISRMK